MAQSIGQYRFRGTGCATKITTAHKAYVSTSNDIAESDDTQASFNDICINFDAALSVTQDYYLKLKVPQDLNYTYTFQIKLTKQNATLDQKDSYQFLRNMTVSKPAIASDVASNVYTVALYKTHNGVKAMIPEDYTAGQATTRDILYREKQNGKYTGVYYLGNGGSGAAAVTKTTDYNDIEMVANWISIPGKYFGYLEIVFRPVATGFNQILLQMNRTAEDYNIQRQKADGSGLEYGRKIDSDLFDFEVYALSDLVQTLNPQGELSRIGVWSHPGLFMAVNGEEIRVGASGFYELSEIPITSLGIYAPDNDFTNNFTVDYTIEDR